MMRNVCFKISVLMVLCLFFAVETGASLGSSKVVADPNADCYQPGENRTLCFLVTNSSPDGEVITDIDLGFPGDWTVMDCCRDGEVCPVNEGYVRA